MAQHGARVHKRIASILLAVHENALYNGLALYNGVARRAYRPNAALSAQCVRGPGLSPKLDTGLLFEQLRLIRVERYGSSVRVRSPWVGVCKDLK